MTEGQPQGDERSLSMVTAMRNELFGSCTNHGECEAVCTKQIPLEFIGKMNRDLIRALWHRHREPLVIPSLVQQSFSEDSREHFHENADPLVEEILHQNPPQTSQADQLQSLVQIVK